MKTKNELKLEKYIYLLKRNLIDRDIYEKVLDEILYVNENGVILLKDNNLMGNFNNDIEKEVITLKVTDDKIICDIEKDNYKFSFLQYEYTDYNIITYNETFKTIKADLTIKCETKYTGFYNEYNVPTFKEIREVTSYDNSQIERYNYGTLPLYIELRESRYHDEGLGNNVLYKSITKYNETYPEKIENAFIFTTDKGQIEIDPKMYSIYRRDGITFEQLKKYEKIMEKSGDRVRSK